jgi:hypothetical protein
MRPVDVLVQVLAQVPDSSPNCGAAPEACSKVASLVGLTKVLALGAALVGVIVGAGMLVLSRVSGHGGGQTSGGRIIMGGLAAGFVIGAAGWLINEAFGFATF